MSWKQKGSQLNGLYGHESCDKWGSGIKMNEKICPYFSTHQGLR
jgi:hypothetical protein